MPRNTQPQRQQIDPTGPYYGEYSRLAEQFLKPNKPIHSAGQGIAEVLGDVGEAYFLKKAAQKEQEKEQKDYSDLAMAQRLAMDGGLAKDQRSGALYSAQDFGGLQTQGIDPMTTQQRGAAAVDSLSQVNPRAAVAGAPGIMEMAKQFEPPVRMIDEKGPGGMISQRHPTTNALDVKVQPDWVQTPEGLNARTAQATASRPQTTINMPVGDSEYEKTRGKSYAEQAGTYQSTGRDAAKRMGTLSVLESALSDPAVYQGTAGNAVTGIKRAGKTLLGLDIDGVGSAEVAQTLGKEMALSLRTNMPGPMSDGDRKFLVELPANLSNSREGNIKLIDYQRRVARREMEVAELARMYETENKRLDVGFDSVLADFAEKNPLFTEKDFEEIAALAGSSGQPSPLAGTEALLREADRIAAGSLGGK